MTTSLLPTVTRIEHNLGRMGMTLGIIGTFWGNWGIEIIGRFWSIFPSSIFQTLFRDNDVIFVIYSRGGATKN